MREIASVAAPGAPERSSATLPRHDRIVVSISKEKAIPPRFATKTYFKEEPDGAGLPPGWLSSGGRWAMHDGRAVQEDTRPGELSEARLPLPAPAFQIQVDLQALPVEGRHPGAFGLLLLDEDGEEVFSLDLLPRTMGNTATGMAGSGSGERRREKALPLSDDFASHALHTVRLEVAGQKTSLDMDGLPAWQGKLDALPGSVVLFTRGMSAAFTAFQMNV